MEAQCFHGANRFTLARLSWGKREILFRVVGPGDETHDASRSE